jgi:cyclopropane-fatty-acyl-phospholipid synthase
MRRLPSPARHAVLDRLAGIRRGALLLRERRAETPFGEPGADPVRIEVHDPRFYGAVALGGAVGAGEAYAEGWWTADDLTGVVRLLLRNREALDGLERGWARLVQPARALLHALRANTRFGARRNIRAHYDLGNEFFRLFLDDTLTYSCALFERPGASLREASLAKYERMARLVELRAGDHLIEIGTGWGGFAIHAASTRGCRVTTATISEEQYRLARARVAAAGLADRVTVARRDYRDLAGTYDKLVSIEMIEAIGHRQYGTFFRTCARLLRPGGRAAIQAITIADDRYEGARREVDFIKRHIFPGSCIPSRRVLHAAAREAGLPPGRTDEIGAHYAETLRRWRVNLDGNRGPAGLLGFDDRFLRLWEFYFSYCEGGFLEGAIGAVQMTLGGPAAAGWADVEPVPPVLGAA